jgi:hypothetical protein
MYYKDWKKIDKPEMKMDVEIGSYHRDLSHISSSWLKEALKSMLRFYSYPFKPEKEQTQSTKIGTLFHSCLLEPDVFEKTYCVVNKSDLPYPESTMAKKENKEYVEAIVNSGMQVVSPDDWNCVSEMKKSVSKNTLIAKYISAGTKEASIYWSDQETGLPLKTRPDLFIETGSKSIVVVDVKTTDSVYPNDFFSSVAKWEYPVQAAMQIDGIESVTGLKVSSYLYLAVEKSYPYEHCLFRLTDDDIYTGRVRYKDLLSHIKICAETDEWSGIGRSQIDRKLLDDNELDIIDVVLPAYYYGK